MVLRRINNLIIILIILCSTSVFSLSVLGPGQKLAELFGIGLTILLLILHYVYGEKTPFKLHFTPFLMLIFLSAITSMFMASYTRNQSMFDSLFAMRALYYYLFYFLLHQLRIRPRDLEIIFIGYGIVHFTLYLIQFFAYPTILFDVFMLSNRGTIRIYLTGSDYLAVCYFMSMFALLRTNNVKYLFYMLGSYSVFVLLGGRQTMALMALILVLAIIFSNKVKSRFSISMLIVISALCIYIAFQDIFNQLVLSTYENTREGSSYVRILASKFFLTDFFKTPVAYITGNGAPHSGSAFGMEMNHLRISRGFYLGDVGIIGSFAQYGLFFIMGVGGIFYQVFRTKIEDHYKYIKYMFFGTLLALITAGGFTAADYVCFVCCLLYLVDLSSEDNQHVYELYTKK